jgi:hypothetical protein
MKSITAEPTEMVLILSKPLRGADDKDILELHLREPTCGELAEAGSAANGYYGDITLLSLLTNQPDFVIKRLGAYDFTKASSFLGSFVRRALTDGNSSSPTSAGTTPAA